MFLSATADNETFVWAILAKSAPLTIALYEGSCDGPDTTPAHELTGFDAAGESETFLDIALDDILATGHVIRIHEADQQAGDALACQAIEPLADVGDDTAVIARNDDVLYRPLAGDESRLTLEARQTVRTGDAINVLERGEGWLTFPDYLIVRIFRDTDMAISVAGDIDPDTPPIIEVELRGGTVFGSRPDPAEVAEQRVTITTAGAVITPTGTKFLVHVDPESETTWVLVASGEVEMQGANEAVTVEAGWQSWTIPGEDPLPPVPATRAMVEALFPDELPLLDDLTLDALMDDVLLGDKTCIVESAQGLRLRSGAGTSFERLESMPDGSEFRASLWSDDLAWAYGTSETDRAGWASSDFLECAWPPSPLVPTSTEPVALPTTAPPSLPTAVPTVTPTATLPPPAEVSDSDGDGLTDDEEEFFGTDPLLADTDVDGLGDGDEVMFYDTDPLNYDTDVDGLSDGQEVNETGTNPLDDDSDIDGLSDGFEVLEFGTNALDFDTDDDLWSDGAELSIHGTDPLNPDSDGDGLLDGEEQLYGANPQLTDTDSDGLTDGEEVRSYGTFPNTSNSDGDGCGDGAEVLTYGTDPVTPDCYPIGKDLGPAYARSGPQWGSVARARH